jgi:hypothetical protein
MNILTYHTEKTTCQFSTSLELFAINCIYEIGAAKKNKSVKKYRSLGDILAFVCRSQFIAIALAIS